MPKMSVQKLDHPLSFVLALGLILPAIMVFWAYVFSRLGITGAAKSVPASAAPLGGAGSY